MGKSKRGQSNTDAASYYSAVNTSIIRETSVALDNAMFEQFSSSQRSAIKRDVLDPLGQPGRGSTAEVRPSTFRFPQFTYSTPASHDRPAKEKINIAALQTGEHPPEVSTPQCITERL
jgi:hypothetical protein